MSAGLPPDPEPPASEIREFSLLSTSLTAAHAALERQALAARQGQALLKWVIEGTPDVLHVKGLDGRAIVANAAADAFFRHTAWPRLVGRCSLALSRPSIVAVAAAHDAQVLRDGRTVTEEYRVRHPVERVFKVTKAPLRQAADGRIAGLIILIQDVTQQRRMEDDCAVPGEMQRLGRRATAGAMAGGLA